MGSTAHAFSESVVQILTKSCDSVESDPCRDDSAALILKLVAVASILLSGATGVAIPLIGRRNSRRVFEITDGGSFYAGVKSFAAGVILATGFVHMLSGASDALTHPCLSKTPWSSFPFPGFFAMVGALLTLLADLLVTRFYERKQEQRAGLTESSSRVGLSDSDLEIRIGLLDSGVDGRGGAARKHAVELHGHVHAHEHRGDGDVDSSTRNVVVSQVLELGIVSHSVIIGLSLGVSQSPCTIKPLIAALSFHQLFEGLALGGCISEARYSAAAAATMACCFAATTPIGIVVGTAASASSWYNPHSAGALVVEGVLDSLSAGILVYVALVDLIAADFLGKRLSSSFKVQILSYCSLFLGAALMSSLEIWA